MECDYDKVKCGKKDNRKIKNDYITALGFCH